MTDHLPECWMADSETAPIFGPFCICPALRACEQRAYTLGIEVGKHDGWLAGHNAGVQAARDVVDGLRVYGDHGEVHPYSPEEAVVYRHEALAAIDALRGEANA